LYDISVIIPAFNESHIISETINKIDNLFKEIGMNNEIIVVNDGSTDDTYEEAKKALKGKENAVIVNHIENKGKGYTIKHGFEFASGRLVTYIDGDMDIDPSQIKTFIDYMVDFDADIVIGSKRHPLSKIEYPYHRKLLSWCYYKLISFLFNLNVKDTQTGLKLFKHEVGEKIFPRILVKKYAFDLEMLVNAKRNGFKIVEAPINLNFNKKKKLGRIGFKHIFKIALDTAAIFYRTYISRYYDGIKSV